MDRGSIENLTSLRCNLDEVAQNLRGVGRGDDEGVLRKIDSELSDVVDFLHLAQESDSLTKPQVQQVLAEMMNLAPIIKGDMELERLDQEKEQLAGRFEKIRDMVKAQESLLIVDCLTEKS